MNRAVLIGLLVLESTLHVCAQLNCNVFKLENNESCYKACELANEAAEMQGFRESQIKFDEAIKLCPILDYAYFEKAVPYLKRGDFITWKKLIDRAVELAPSQHLGYRGWCRFQFVRDYEGAIQDLEKLEMILEGNVGYSVNGDYHLSIAKALCYKMIGEKAKAIHIIETQLAKKDYSPLAYDYLHLGVLKYETNAFDEAITYLQKSIDFNDYLAEPYYYLGLIYKKQQKLTESRVAMEKAKAYYLKGYKRFDPYTNPIDKVFLSQIEAELK
jgi:tetratricopeptide (TPR) repeat protein